MFLLQEIQVTIIGCGPLLKAIDEEDWITAIDLCLDKSDNVMYVFLDLIQIAYEPWRCKRAL